MLKLAKYLNIKSSYFARLQRMAVFCEISGGTMQIVGAGAQNSCQVRIMGELRGKSNKICVKNKK